MKKYFYFLTTVALVGSASSCSKCVQCTATDKLGVTVNTSMKICEPDFSRNQFIDRYNENFKDYNPRCAEVQE